MNRRDFLKKLGLTGAAATAAVVMPLDLLAEPTASLIEGDIDQVRASNILWKGPEADPTREELRIMLRDCGNLPENQTYIGLQIARILVIDVVMDHECLDFRTDILTCPEFRAMMPRYRPILKEMDA